MRVYSDCPIDDVPDANNSHSKKHASPFARASKKLRDSPMTNPDKPNWSAAKVHVAALTGHSSTPVTIQTFDDGHQDGRLASWRHGRLTDHEMQKWIVARYKRGAGVFITINETDGAGRRGENITRYRAAFVDLDGAPLPTSWPLQPSFVDESSPGKFHIYWLLHPGTDFTAWLDLQARLAAYYKGDKAMADRARVLRLVGFDHQKADPFRVHFLGEVDPVGLQFDRHNLEDVAAAHQVADFTPPAERQPKQAPANIEWDTEEAIAKGRAYLKRIDLPQEGERNRAAYAAACHLNDFGISPAQSFALLADWNDGLATPLEDRELEAVVRSATKYKQNPPGSAAAEREEALDAMSEIEEPSEWDAAELERLQAGPQQWIVRDIVPADEAILNNGAGGTGKTTTMLQLAVSVATGKDWLGHPIECGSQRVIFFSCEEDTKKVKLKLAPAVESEKSPYRISWSDLGNLKVIGLKGRETSISNFNPKTGTIAANDLYKYFAEKIREFKPRLIIIDALYDIYAGNINDTTQVRRFVSMVRKFCSIAPPCAVIVLGHPSQSGITQGTGMSGAMTWYNAFRGFLFTTADKKKNGQTIHKIESRKQSYGAPDAEIDFYWDELFHHVVDDAKEKLEAEAEATLLKLIAATNADGRGVSMSKRGNYAPRELSKDPRARDFTAKDFEAAMYKLISSGKLKEREYKTIDRKIRARLEIVTVVEDFSCDGDKEASEG
jgi:RecA-family ATPase